MYEHLTNITYIIYIKLIKYYLADVIKICFSYGQRFLISKHRKEVYVFTGNMTKNYGI